MSDRIGVGVIGCGPMGRIHARSLATIIRGAHLVAVADLDRGLAEATATDANAESKYGSVDELIADSSIEAVVIATPPETHSELIERAATAGKHVLCEKPVAVTLEETDAAIAAAGRQGVKLMIGFNRRFDATIVAVREAITSDKVGRLYTLRIVSRDPAAGTRTPQGARDLFLDTTIHDFDMARHLSGEEVESVYVAGAQMGRARGNPDTAVTVLRLTSGAVVTIDNSRLSAHGYDQRVEVFGSEGAISSANVVPHQTVLQRAEGALTPRPFEFFAERYAASYAAEMQAFIDCVRGNTPPPVTGADGRAALVLALAAQLSYQERRPVALSEI